MVDQAGQDHTGSEAAQSQHQEFSTHLESPWSLVLNKDTLSDLALFTQLRTQRQSWRERRLETAFVALAAALWVCICRARIFFSSLFFLFPFLIDTVPVHLNTCNWVWTSCIIAVLVIMACNRSE